MRENEKAFYSKLLSYPPYIKNPLSLSRIMWTVIFAMLPSVLFAVYSFGIKIVWMLLISVFSSMAAEGVMQSLRKQKITVSDGSAIITGFLIVMNMPPDAPLWLPACGSVFAIIIIKQVFGGLGYNIFNPALAAKAMLILIWPAFMKPGWINKISAIANERLPYKIFEAAEASNFPGSGEIPDFVSGFGITLNKVYYTFLSDSSLYSLFSNNLYGYIGEASAVLLLIGGLFLIFRRIISWHVPVSYAVTVSLILFAHYNYSIKFPYPERAAIFHLLTGGMAIGIFFMATDYVTSPVTKKGLLLFGAGCGILTSLLSIWGISESVCFAILFMNTIVPWIDKLTAPKIFGTG
jgi:Na+-translocating ferredoxin:NAD+ oxidoreductase subunit D